MKLRLITFFVVVTTIITSCSDSKFSISLTDNTSHIFEAKIGMTTDEVRKLIPNKTPVVKKINSEDIFQGLLIYSDTTENGYGSIQYSFSDNKLQSITVYQFYNNEQTYKQSMIDEKKILMDTYTIVEILNTNRDAANYGSWIVTKENDTEEYWLTTSNKHLENEKLFQFNYSIMSAKFLRDNR